MKLDIQIRGGMLCDGTGSSSRCGCLDIRGDKIVGVGTKERDARLVIDARGKYVCPGFVDAHSHADLAAVSRVEMEGALRQGVTTCVTGNCGFAVFPLIKETGKAVLEYGRGIFGSAPKEQFADFQQYKEWLSSQGTAVNVVPLAGHGPLHQKVMGFSKGEPGPAELEVLCEELDSLMGQGAAGLSFGFIYTPGAYTGRKEVGALLHTVGKWNKPVTVHLHNEGEYLLESMEWIAEMAEKAGVHLHFSHHKVMGCEYWGKSRDSLALLDRLKKAGIKASLDVYPYQSACSTAMVLLPPWVLEGGTESAVARLSDPVQRQKIFRDMQQGISGWENLTASCGFENLVILSKGSVKGLFGKTLADLARTEGKDPIYCLLDLLQKAGSGVNVKIQGMCQEDVGRILQYPDAVIGSDGLFAGESAHPRRNGSFAKVLREYVKERKLLSLEQAVEKMTSKTAAIFRISQRGILKTGYYADVLVFHPAKIQDRADYTHPNYLAEGMEYVILNGKLAIHQGNYNQEKFGRVLV